MKEQRETVESSDKKKGLQTRWIGLKSQLLTSQLNLSVLVSLSVNWE